MSRIRLIVAIVSFAALIAAVGAAALVLRRHSNRRQFQQNLEALKSADPFMRANTAEYLGNLYPYACDCLPDLIAMLNDGDPVVRVKAAEAVWKLDSTRAYLVLPVLMKELNGDQSMASRSAVLAVGRMGAAGMPASAALRKLLEVQGDSYGKVIAACALTEVDQEWLPKCVTILMESLGDEQAIVRWQAVKSLAKIASRNPDVRVSIRRMLHDEDPNVRLAAEHAIAVMDKEARAN